MHDRAIVDNECPSDCAQGAFDLIDVGPVLGIHDAVHGRVADAKAPGQLDLGDAIALHDRVQGQFRCDQGRRRDHDLAGGRCAGSRQRAVRFDVAGQRADQGFFGETEGLVVVPSRQERVWVRACCEQC